MTIKDIDPRQFDQLAQYILSEMNRQTDLEWAIKTETSGWNYQFKLSATWGSHKFVWSIPDPPDWRVDDAQFMDHFANHIASLANITKRRMQDEGIKYDGKYN